MSTRGLTSAVPPSPRRRCRPLGVTIGILEPGRHNAITDVAGVQVGHITLLANLDAKPIRTGVTAILPHPGNVYAEPVLAALHTINGYGKATGFAQVAELGLLETPIVLTNTLSVGVAATALVRWCLARSPDALSINPVVGECNDGHSNDIAGLHITQDHVLSALENAAGGPVSEGTIGAGTGMVGYGHQGGIGTASRVLATQAGGFCVGALVLLNCGQRQDLLVSGVPVGRALAETPASGALEGSIIIVLATDAPATARQLGRLARRAVVGLARTGSIVGHSSGDFVFAFSTAQRLPRTDRELVRELRSVNDGQIMNQLFRGVIESTEEAILNALFTARTVPGSDGTGYPELPIDAVLTQMRLAGRLG